MTVSARHTRAGGGSRVCQCAIRVPCSRRGCYGSVTRIERQRSARGGTEFDLGLAQQRYCSSRWSRPRCFQALSATSPRSPCGQTTSAMELRRSCERGVGFLTWASVVSPAYHRILCTVVVLACQPHSLDDTLKKSRQSLVDDAGGISKMHALAASSNPSRAPLPSACPEKDFCPWHALGPIIETFSWYDASGDGELEP